MAQVLTVDGPVRADPPAADAVPVALGASLRRAVGTGRLGVAFSGGVDSSVLLAAAVRVLAH